MRRPACCKADIADSRPLPGPLTLISTSLTPYRIALLAQRVAACDAANGVLLREPLNPTQPADLEQIASPFASALVISVLLNVALICTIAFATFRFIFLFALFAIFYPLPARLFNALLSCNGPSRAFPGPGISSCPLASDRQVLLVPQTPVASDFL